MASPLWTIHNNRSLVTVDSLSTEQALSLLRAEQPGDLQYWFAWREGMASWNPVVTVAELDLRVPAVAPGKPEPPKTPAAPPAQVPSTQVEEIMDVVIFSDESTPAPVATPVAPKALVKSGEEGPFGFQPNSPAKPAASAPAPPDGTENFEIYWMSDGDQPPERADFNFTVQQENRIESRTNQVTLAGHGQDERRKYPRIDIRLKVLIQNDNVTFRTYTKNASLGGVALEVAIPPILVGQNCLIHVTEPKSLETIKFSGRMLLNREQTRYFTFFRASAENILKLQKWLQAIPKIKQAS